ncbi:MAG: hypothetical protein JSV88_27885 [Candidatus Aminicenantes bacterium]|nr:MAG: hypothetical protein JSV88_27885 [Candidatus Aminicenantes bacterium]
MIKLKRFGSFLIYTLLILSVCLVLPQALQAQQQSYTVSGTVLDTGGRGIDGVSVIFFGEDINHTVTTSGGGHYSYDVYATWSGTVTASHDCYSFTPVSPTVGPVTADTVQDFTGTLLTYTISGFVTDGVNPIAGADLTLSTGGGTISGADGSYSLTVPCGWEGTVTPMKVGWNFSPPSRDYEYVGADYTDQNFEGTVSSTTYKISGQVTDETGRIGMDGVTIEFFDGTSIHTETTSGGGYYSYTVPEFWTGTIIPGLTGYTFTPTFATVDPVQSNITQDFIACQTSYVISGIVMDENLNPISGVTIRLSTGASLTTGANGDYSFTLVHGWSGTVTPSRPGWVFEPRKRTYSNLGSDQTNQHYVGYHGSNRVTISGAARQSDGTGIPGVTLTFSGQGTAVTDDNGDYSKLVLFGWSGTVTPAKAGYTFSPTSRTYTSIKTDQPDQDYIDYTAGASPEISLSPIKLNFAADASGNVSGAQSFLVSNSGGGTLNWTVSAVQGWISFSPSSGTNSGYVTVSVDPTGLSADTYNGTITVSDPNAANSPQTVTVELNIYSSTSPPFGDFDTPLDGTTVRSSVPFTGWALDDIKVESVKIYRKENGSLFFIGDAVFVEGARPDVELLYLDYPYNNRAGWGYMMLTYFLPDGGNGTYTFCAMATDVEGNEVTLGSKTITVDNANAVKPFGTIDLPTQGGEASGSSFKNTGWVLTPLPNKVPEDGSTINVFVDGVNLGHPTYNIYREDIATLFPGYANSNGAHAYFNFDTTGYANGVHTIYWTASDDAGNTDGIGSRFFTIRNTANGTSAKSKTNCISAGTFGTFIPPLRGFKTYRATDIPVNHVEPIELKRGFNQHKGLEKIYPDKNGRIAIEIKESEPVEIHPGKIYAGYLVVGKEYRALPFGSRLDIEKGVFYWLPVPAYYGIYRLVFVVEGANHRSSQREIIVNIRPAF